MLVSGGYPGDFEKGKVISGLEQVSGSLVFHAGTKASGASVLSSGGRVIALTSYGSSLKEALGKSFKNAELVAYDGKYYRRDIGFDL